LSSALLGNEQSASQLVIKLAEAIGHAHARGIVHRDLKPANILIESASDGEWKPKIVDFGLAKQHDASGVATATGVLLGTPKYICQDLRRWNEGLPIHARPIRWTTKLLKLAKRHPMVSTLSICLVLGMISLLATSVVYNRWLTHALHEQEIESSRANENFQVAFDAVDKMLERVGFDQLANQPGMEVVREELLADAVDLYSSLLSTPRNAGEFGVSNKQPVSGIELQSFRQYANSLSKLGRIRTLLGQHQPARESLSEAIALQQSLVSGYPDKPELFYDLAISHLSLGRVEQQSSEFQTAINLLRPIRDSYPKSRLVLAQALNQFAIPLAPKEQESTHREVLEIASILHRDDPNDPQIRHMLGQVLHNLGLMCHQTGRTDEADRFLREGLDQLEWLVVTHEGVFDYQSSLAESLAVIAATQFGKGQSGEGKRSMDRSTSIRELLVARYPKLPALRETLSRSYQTHTAFLFESRQLGGAVELARRGVDIAEKLRDQDPSEHTKYFLASSQIILATAMGANEQVTESADIIKTACKAFEELLAKSPDDQSYQIEAGVAFMNYSNWLRPSSAAEALVFGDRSVDLLSSAYANSPTRADLRTYLFNAFGARAQSLDALQRHCEAADSWKLAMETLAADASSFLRINYALSSVRCGRFETTAWTGQLLMSRQDLDGLTHYNLACLFCFLDQMSPVASATQSYRNLAVELLNRQSTQEFFRHETNLQQLLKDSDLDSIRKDPCFADLLARLSQ